MQLSHSCNRNSHAGPGEAENGKPKAKKKRARPPTNAPIAETRGSGDLGHGKGQKGSKGAPEDSQLSPVRPNGKQSPLTLVDFQEEGLQQERLGELDLKQLDSFRWGSNPHLTSTEADLLWWK